MKRIVTWVIILGAAAFILYNVFWRPREVVSRQSSSGDIVLEALGTGSIESRKTIELGFELTGRITELLVDQGDTVVKGQELARLDAATFEAEVALAEQEVAHTKATVRRLGTDIGRARAVLQGAQDNLDRTKPQVEKGVATLEILDVAEERVKVALAELSRAEAALIEGEQVVLSAVRKLDRAKTDLGKTTAICPLDGVVIRRESEVGSIVSPGTPVLRIASTETIWASVWVDETYLDGLRVGLKARTALRSAPEEILLGKVARIGREVDRETRELLVDVVFDSTPKNLVFGQRVDLWIELKVKKDVRRVDARFLTYQDGEEGVFIEVDGRAEFRKLKLGIRGRELVEVLEGLDSEVTLIAPLAQSKKPLSRNQRVVFPKQDSGGQKP